jgi:hypothetical protein
MSCNNGEVVSPWVEIVAGCVVLARCVPLGWSWASGRLAVILQSLEADRIETHASVARHDGSLAVSCPSEVYLHAEEKIGFQVDCAFPGRVEVI